jgi:hypothetical protein
MKEMIMKNESIGISAEKTDEKIKWKFQESIVPKFSFLGGAEICTQGLHFSRQALYHLGHTSNLSFCFSYFSDKERSGIFTWSQPQQLILLTTPPT